MNEDLSTGAARDDRINPFDAYSDPTEVASRVEGIIKQCDLSNLEIDPPGFRKGYGS